VARLTRARGEGRDAVHPVAQHVGVHHV
jgi:hypothetical protein